MAFYKPRKPKVSIYYKKKNPHYRRKNTLRHVVILSVATVIIGAAAFGTHALLSPFHVAVQADAPVTSQAAQKSTSHSAIDKNSWQLRLVNATHPLPADFTVETSPVGNARFDSRAAGSLQKLINDCNNEGNHLLICSGYRSVSLQTTLYKTEIRKAERKGSSDAAEEAATVVAKPGTSEHNSGLAVDFGSKTNQLCDETFGKTPEGQWLMDNAYKYGFILRYPKGKEKFTGIIYEPWHYRYVGITAAKEIREKGVCLEEYLA